MFIKKNKKKSLFTCWYSTSRDLKKKPKKPKKDKQLVIFVNVKKFETTFFILLNIKKIMPKKKEKNEQLIMFVTKKEKIFTCQSPCSNIRKIGHLQKKEKICNVI